MSGNLFEHNQEIIVKTFVPDIYMDRIDKNNKDSNNIPDSDSKATGIYRFYGIFVGSEQKIGYIKYHIKFNESEIKIDSIGYGTMLMKQSLFDLVNDFPYIESVSVCSSSFAIPFYIKNGFKPYFGDNNLIKTLIKRKH